MNKYLTFPFACAALVSTACTTAAQENSSKPNVIIVITDDQGYGDIASHGNPYIKTPQIDKLREQSLRLTDFHVDPTCSPSRSALMTGHYSTRAGVWHTVAGRSLMHAEETTMADVFKKNGYATGMFGKWHLGDNYPYRPFDRGFDTVVWHKGGGVGQGADYFGNDYFDDTYFVKDKPQKFTGYCTDVWFDNSLKFIEDNKNKPFFCYLSTNAPHHPYLVDKKYSDPYKAIKTKNGKGVPSAFYGMITNIDDNLGRLTKKLDELGLADNTLLIFMSDNGSAAGWRAYNAGMRAGKGSNFDGGHRVPFFLRWPRAQLSLQDFPQLTAHVDILPTLIDLCGLKADRAQYDGHSLKKMLQNPNLPTEDRTLIVESQRVLKPTKWRNCAVLTQKWRLLNGEKLYDIQKDPGQEKNLANKFPEVVKTLRASYEKNWVTLKERQEDTTPISLGAPQENPTMLMNHDSLTGRKVAYSHKRVSEGILTSSRWYVKVEQEGVYTFQLRRWPKEINKAIHSRLPHSKPVLARKAQLKIGDFDKTIEVTDKTIAATFEVTLKKGNYYCEATFHCDDGGRGAYYVDVEKK